MCGIVAYVGANKACPIILNGLKRLEYRGYDSAGIAWLESGEIQIEKKAGKVKKLVGLMNSRVNSGTVGIGHTRWATHGSPTDVNAHPHRSNSGKLCLVHNGIIENYTSLKEELLTKGYTFESSTDTEILVNFIVRSTTSMPRDIPLLK